MQWKDEILEEIFKHSIVWNIQATQLPNSPESDLLKWTSRANGELTAIEAYLFNQKNRALKNTRLQPSQGKALWRARIHERFKLILWKVVWNVLPTNEAKYYTKNFPMLSLPSTRRDFGAFAAPLPLLSNHLGQPSLANPSACSRKHICSWLGQDNSRNWLLFTYTSRYSTWISFAAYNLPIPPLVDQKFQSTTPDKPRSHSRSPLNQWEVVITSISMGKQESRRSNNHSRVWSSKVNIPFWCNSSTFMYLDCCRSGGQQGLSHQSMVFPNLWHESKRGRRRNSLASDSTCRKSRHQTSYTTWRCLGYYWGVEFR